MTDEQYFKIYTSYGLTMTSLAYFCINRISGRSDQFNIEILHTMMMMIYSQYFSRRPKYSEFGCCFCLITQTSRWELSSHSLNYFSGSYKLFSQFSSRETLKNSPNSPGARRNQIWVSTARAVSACPAAKHSECIMRNVRSQLYNCGATVRLTGPPSPPPSAPSY